ncbi:hypothetical protein FTUN_5278 [Frigoriglobus tundricola]|uniref:Uncharacterized protein n=1 Tax=Frigoriglobus tundricola TaxID=2774151 RepID=A0A6M5YWN1_9BACT|nr:hypothetical protein FTUN_5278 [Frigoriglobus tundricola]
MRQGDHLTPKALTFNLIKISQNYSDLEFWFTDRAESGM